MKISAIIVSAAALTIFGFSTPSRAIVLSAPTNLSCNIETDFVLDWDDLGGAEKYAVDIVCSDGDGNVTAEFSEGTSACSDPDSFLFTDEDCDISVSAMTVPITALTSLGAGSGDNFVALVRGLHKRGSNRPTIHLPANDACGPLP